MKKISQVILKILIVFLLIQIINVPSICYADSWGDIINSGDAFLQEGKDSGGSNILDNGKVKVEFNKIYNILFALGVALTVIVGAVLGIKYIFGSIEEQVKVKETLIPYLAGCIVIYGAFGIWKLVVTLLSNI